MKFTIFGESHGPAIGVTLTGVPSGITIDKDKMRSELSRRATGKNALSTARKEADEVEFLSGTFNGVTTGTPLCMMIRNGDHHSSDYEDIRTKARPGHADYAGWVRYGGYNDYRGGGHFSGRLTAPLVAAGSVAKQILEAANIRIYAHICRVGDAVDAPIDPVAPDTDLLSAVAGKEFPVIDDVAGKEMQEEILTAREQKDSVGGAIECVITGMPAGLGSPDFGENVEGILSQYMFAVPAVKGIEFGVGFEFSEMRGSLANDSFCMSDEGEIGTRTNNNGGINGGITNGMPILFRVAMKPTPSIGLPQVTVDFEEMTETGISIHGRHDPCIVHRAVPVIEAAAALAMCQLMGI